MTEFGAGRDQRRNELGFDRATWLKKKEEENQVKKMKEKMEIA